MPIAITKNLVERIIPELPLEPDIDVARAYVELLGNIVQLYGKRALQ
jgi:tetrahydromethanopterin S-methyltransferase subunit F